jgi:hypothetical protein
VETLYKDTPEMRTSPLIRTPSMAPAAYRVYKTPPENLMRTPPLIRTLRAGPRVSGIEGFHCIVKVYQKVNVF